MLCRGYALIILYNLTLVYGCSCGFDQRGLSKRIRHTVPMALYATKNEESRGRRINGPEAENRAPFQRDRDRIIHSNAFRRLKHKTQVFVYHEGDYFRTRLTHSIEVAQIARTITRSLGANEDLAEAVALAHDLGHTPFGHAGEDALSAALADAGGFDHNVQTLRILTRLEQRYADFDGLNLTWETLEGVVKHNGPMAGPNITTPKAIAAFDASYPLDLASYAGLEAQIAALSDDVAYNSHDIDDGLRAGLFDLDDLRDLPLLSELLAEVDRKWPGLERQRKIYELVRQLIGALVMDLTLETQRRLKATNPTSAADVRDAGKPMAAFSEDMETTVNALRMFLKTHMYRHYRVNRMTSKARRIVTDLFQLFVEEPENLPEAWRQAAVGDAPQHRMRIVGDYIAGMTDRYAMLEHQRLVDIYSRTI